ncbi:MAG: PAS domain S-box protein [bacterium]|nr:PAS domain S-box protein [bacterium]
MRRGAIIACILLASIAPIAAQNTVVHFERIGLAHGLSHRDVNVVFGDSVGFMWFGTQDGLNRYDGLDFRVYKHDASNPDSLRDDFVWDIDEDSLGNLWIGTRSGGVSRWDRTTDRFTHYRHDPQNAATLSSDRVREIEIAADGGIWVSTFEHGVNRIDPATGTVTRFRNDPDDPASLLDDRTRALYVDGDGEVWVGTLSGLSRLDPLRERFTHYRFDADRPSSLIDDRVRSIHEDAGGNIWVGTFAGLCRFERSTGRWVRYVDEPLRVRSVFEDSESRIWIGTDNGLRLLLPGTGTFTSFNNDTADDRSLSANRVTSLFEDPTGILWIGTFGGGINKWNPATLAFSHYRSQTGQPGLSSNQVMALSEAEDGTLWIGTFGGGLNRLDPEAETFSNLTDDPAYAGFADNRVMSLLHDADDHLWIGTVSGGLSRIDAGTGELTSLVHDPDDAASLSTANGVAALFADSRGTLWAGTYGGGVNLLTDVDAGFVHLRHDSADPTSISSDLILCFAEAPDGRVWVGTDGEGLNLVDPATRRAVRFRLVRDDPHSLASNVVYSLHYDESGTLWIGTQGGGLNRLIAVDERSATLRVERFTERSGLPNDDVYGILSDADGCLWMSTNNGLARLDPGTGEVKAFDETHGLQSRSFNFGAHHRGASGRLYFGGPNGFNAFRPDELPTRTVAPAVVFTQFLKFNRPVSLDRAIYATDRVELDHRDTHFSFEFAALDFASPSKNRYAYKLEGFDDDWIQLGNLNRLTYTNLDPGDYVLRVKAANSDGVWNEAGAALPLYVFPAPWKSRWAYGFYGLLLLSTIVGLVRFQRGQVRRAEERRYRSLIELSHGLIFTHDLGGRLRSMNPAGERLLGYSAAQLVGRHLEEFLSPIDGSRIGAYLERLESNGTDTGLMLLSAAEGEQRILAYRNAVCRGSDAGGSYVLSSALDVTELKRAEEQLRKVEARYHDLYHNAPDLYFTVNRDGIVRSVNRFGAACLGYGLADLVGRPLLDLVHEQDVETMHAKLHAAFGRRPLSGDLEFRMLHPMGSTLWFQERMRAVEGNDGAELELQIVCRDITDRKRVEEERQQLQAQVQHTQKLESLGVLAGGIAHDFNNLLSGILGNAEVALMDLPHGSEVREPVETIRGCAMRAAELTGQMLAYAGKTSFEPKPFNLTHLTEEMGNLLSSVISKKARLVYECDAELPPILGEAAQMQQIVMNLMTNASDALGDRSGTITVRARVRRVDTAFLAGMLLGDDLEPGNYVALEVQDTGSGMDAEAHSRIFDPFFSTKFVGRGLGLAAVLGIVRSHRGAIRVDSRPGHGTTMTVLFPIAPGEVTQPVVQPEPPAQWRGSGTVLVADDEDVLRAMLKEVLERQGFSVLTAIDGHEAVDVFNRNAHEIRAVLLDMTMPGMDGREAFDRIHVANPATPVVLLSGHSEQDAVDNFPAPGPAGFLHKPFPMQMLIEKLRQLLDR